jgi:hypothetical protein
VGKACWGGGGKQSSLFCRSDELNEFYNVDARVVVSVENVNTHKPEWFPDPVPNETVEIEEELEETDFVVLKGPML